MLTDEQKHFIVEAIKRNTNPSDLEKDIIDITEELSKQTLDYNTTQAKINDIYIKYNDLYIKVSALPTTVQKQACQITETDLRYILKMQLNFLFQKEWEATNNGR